MKIIKISLLLMPSHTLLNIFSLTILSEIFCNIQQSYFNLLAFLHSKFSFSWSSVQDNRSILAMQHEPQEKIFFHGDSSEGR
jgi:hypothetical protein